MTTPNPSYCSPSLATGGETKTMTIPNPSHCSRSPSLRPSGLREGAVATGGETIAHAIT